MRESQRKAIIILAIFWLLIFGVIAVFYLYYAAMLFTSWGTPGIIIGGIVFLYLIVYSIAMQP